VKISIGVPPGPQARPLAVLAEELGYHRVWLYDSAALYEDVYVHLALIAESTRRIGLGTAVLVPNLRHVMTTASAIATIERLAPGRLVCAVGTGFTARLVLDQKPLPWRQVREWVLQLKGLLRGEVVRIDGKACQMIHHEALAKPRPIEVPILLSAFGPKGLAVAREIADGWMGMAPPPERFEPAVQMMSGTVLEPGESPASPRVFDAVGAWQAVMAHGIWATAPQAVDSLPGGAAWRTSVEADRPEGERHLVVHQGHCTHVTPRDRILLDALRAAGENVPWLPCVGSAEDVRKRVEASAAAGVSEILYTPAGSDLLREARAFFRAVAPLAS
jgi:5,10-methylenetetrahydromethanopterin reductase